MQKGLLSLSVSEQEWQKMLAPLNNICSDSMANRQIQRVEFVSQLHFRCLDGKVTNARTNGRVAELRCGESRFFDVAGVQRCVAPTHCVGRTATAG